MINIGRRLPARKGGGRSRTPRRVAADRSAATQDAATRKSRARLADRKEGSRAGCPGGVGAGHRADPERRADSERRRERARHAEGRDDGATGRRRMQSTHQGSALTEHKRATQTRDSSARLEIFFLPFSHFSLHSSNPKY